MTRKDYELIAAALHRSQMAKSLIGNTKERQAALNGIYLVASDLAATLRHDNPRFDSERFLRAAGF